MSDVQSQVYIDFKYLSKEEKKLTWKMALRLFAGYKEIEKERWNNLEGIRITKLHSGIQDKF